MRLLHENEQFEIIIEMQLSLKLFVPFPYFVYPNCYICTPMRMHTNTSERVAEWLRRLTGKPKVRTAVGSNPTLDSLVAVRNTSPGQPEPCEGNLVAVAGSCRGLMVKHPWPLLEISLSDFRGLATLNINTYLHMIFHPFKFLLLCLLSAFYRILTKFLSQCN